MAMADARGHRCMHAALSRARPSPAATVHACGCRASRGRTSGRIAASTRSMGPASRRSCRARSATRCGRPTVLVVMMHAAGSCHARRATPFAAVAVVVATVLAPQNWAGGNDLDNAYLFQPPSTWNDGPWAGGINTTVYSQAEQRSYGWYHYYKGIADASVQPYLQLNNSQTNTTTFLPKMPYLRDTRRCVVSRGRPHRCLGHASSRACCNCHRSGCACLANACTAGAAPASRASACSLKR